MYMNCFKLRVTTDCIPFDLKVESIGMLTEEQYFKYKEDIPACPELWWLLGKEYAESPDSVYEGYAKCVVGRSGFVENKRAYENFEDISIYDIANIRPIITTNSTLRVGDTFLLCDGYTVFELTAISPNMAIFSKPKHAPIPYSENMIKDYLEDIARLLGRDIKVVLDVQ